MKLRWFKKARCFHPDKVLRHCLDLNLRPLKCGASTLRLCYPAVTTKLQYSCCAHCQSCTVLVTETHFPAPLGKGWHTTGTDVFRGRREIEHKSHCRHPPATYFGLHTFSAYNLPTNRRLLKVKSAELQF